MNYLTLYLFIGVAFSLGVFFVLPRRITLILALIALLLGVAAPLCLWGYASVFVPGDSSAYGMFGTIMAIFFAPSGLMLVVLGLLKSD